MMARSSGRWYGEAGSHTRGFKFFRPVPATISTSLPPSPGLRRLRLHARFLQGGKRILFLALATGGGLFDAHQYREIGELARQQGLADIEVGEHLRLILTQTLDHLAHEILVGGVHHAHDDVGVALRQRRLIKPRGPLTDENEADAKLAPFLRDLLGHRDGPPLCWRARLRWRKVVRLFKQQQYGKR